MKIRSIYMKSLIMYIYKITNNINGKIYIGKHESERKNYWGSGTVLKLAIKKYGLQNFTKDIIEYCKNSKQLSIREIFWIKHYNSRNRLVGYNITKGGDGVSGLPSIWRTRKFSDEHRMKISKNHADVNGEKNPMFGKTHKDSVKENLRKIKTGLKYSQECKLKHSEKNKGDRNPNSKLNDEIVLNIRTDYNNGTNMKDLADKYNVNKPCVWKIVHNYTWKHLI